MITGLLSSEIANESILYEWRLPVENSNAKNLQLKKVSKFFSAKFCKPFFSLNSLNLIVFYFKNCHCFFLFSICTVTMAIWNFGHFKNYNFSIYYIVYLLLIRSYIPLSAQFFILRVISSKFSFFLFFYPFSCFSGFAFIVGKSIKVYSRF